MATQTKIELICDLTGDPADETVEFGLAGKVYELDLTKQHAAALKEILEDYVKVARPVGKLSTSAGLKRGSGSTSTQANRDQTAAIRRWAREAGKSVSDRGRIPLEIKNEFEQAHRSSLASVG